MNLNKYGSRYSSNIYQTRTTETNNENKYRFNNSTEERTTNTSNYVSKYTNNQYQNKTNSSRGTISSQNYNNYRAQKQDTLSTRNYNTQTQGSQSTNYGNYRKLTQNSRGTQSTKNFGSYRNDKYNESYKRIQMTQKADEGRRYNSNREYEGKNSEGTQMNDISKRNEISYINRRANSNANTRSTIANRSQYVNANKRKNNDSLNGRKHYIIESKRVERRYNNIPINPNQKRNAGAYKRQIVNVIDTEKYKRRNTPMENKRLNQNITEVKEIRGKYTGGRYVPNQYNKSQVDKYKYERISDNYKEETRYSSNKYGQDKLQNTNKYGMGRSYNPGNYGSNNYGRGMNSKNGSYGADKYGRGRDSNKVDIYNKYRNNIKEVNSKGDVNKSDKYGIGMDTQVRTYESSQYTRTYNRIGADNDEEASKYDKYGRGIDSQGRAYEAGKYGRGRGKGEEPNKKDTYNQYRRDINNEKEANKYGRGIDSQENIYEYNQYINEEDASRPNKYGRDMNSQVRTYESNQYTREYNRRGKDSEEDEIYRADKYRRGMDSKGGAYGTDEFGRGIDTNEETFGANNYGKEIYSKEGTYGTNELGRGMDSSMPNQQTQEIYQNKKMVYSQQVNDDEQYINKGPHFCPIHGYHNIYDEENQNNNQFDEDQREINQYGREEGIEQRYDLNQLNQEELKRRQEAFEQRNREYLQKQGQYQQSQELNQRFINNMKGFADGEQRYGYMQQQINNTQRNMNIKGQDYSKSDNYRFYESKYVSSSDDNVNIIATAYGKDTSNVTFTYASSNDTVLSVDANGRMTALAKGEADITVSFSNDSNVNLTFKVQVNDLDNSTDVDKVLELLVANHFDVVETGNVSIYDDGREKYYQSVYGSVNRFLFDEYVVNTKYVETAVNTGTCHSTRDSQDTIQLVCVHDTATLTGTVENIASGMAAATGNGASIHYTVGNLKIYQVVPEYLIAWHAGDGTGVKFYWTASGVKTATNTEPVYDVKRVDNTYYLVINNEVSKIALPSTGSSITKNILTELGPVWKIENGEYYIGNLWYSSTYGKIASKGGNNNAIGIEMNVNISNDIYDTWQRTAQLVTDILIRYDLDTSRVKMHNTFSGKYCPECLIASGYWPGFMKMVQVRYDIMKNYPDAKITMESNNSDIVDDTGRVINPPRTTTQVSYDITVTIGSTSKTITLYSIIPGTTTWEQWNGTHPSSQVWNNGKFVR